MPMMMMMIMMTSESTVRCDDDDIQGTVLMNSLSSVRFKLSK